MSGHALFHEYTCTIEELDSHPLGEELGLATQTTRWAVRTRSNFTLEAGRVLWDSAV